MRYVTVPISAGMGAAAFCGAYLPSASAGKRAY